MTRKKLLTAEQAREYVYSLQKLFTAQEAGVAFLLSEDFQHERLLDGARTINLFISNSYWSII